MTKTPLYEHLLSANLGPEDRDVERSKSPPGETSVGYADVSVIPV
jgi:hypothetical protein